MTAILAQASFERIDLIVLVGYLLGVVALGAYFVRKSNTVEGFTVGSRALPGWAVGLSILGTYLSSISFLALPGKSYDANWNYFAFSLTLPVAALIAVIWFLPIYRRKGLISAYEFLEERIGPGARLYAGACFVLLQITRVGIILYLVALAMEPMTGLEAYQLILIAGALVTLYTVLGGIEAVIWTDVVQVIVLSVGAVFCAILLLLDFPEGPSQLFAIANAEHKFSMGPDDWSLTDSTILVVVIYGFTENLKNFGIEQTYVQRFVCAESDKAAARSLWIGALAYIPLAALFFFIGTALFAYYQVQPDLLPASVTKGDEVFPAFIQQRVPVGARGLLLAAIVAAAMSTVDSGLNSSSTVCMVDFYRRHLRPDADDRQCLRVVRWLTVLFGFLGTITGLAMIGIYSAIDLWWQLAGIFGGTFLGLFLLALLVRRIRAGAVVASVAAGVLGIVWVTWSQHLPASLAWARCDWHTLMAGPTGTAVMLVVGLLLAGFRTTDPAPPEEPTDREPLPLA